MPIEAIRQSYLPKIVNVLFVGESAPSAGTFFYKGDSLTQYTMEAFNNAYSANYFSHTMFLDRFKSKNFYLDDLCLEPVNNLTPIAKKDVRRNSVKKFSSRLGIYSPKAIICIMFAIEQYVKDAMKMAAINENQFYSLPFPAYSDDHIKQYISGLSNVLNELKKKKVISSTF